MSISLRSLRFLLPAIALAAVPTGAWSQQPTAPARAAPPAAAPAASTTPTVSLAEGYVIGVGDIVEVSVLGRPEFTPRVQVQVDGTIQLPFLKSVPAAERTVLQLREDVRGQLQQGGYYTDPVVAVAVVSYSSRYVTVLGEVGTPGLLPVDRAYRVSEVLAKVGGPRATGEDEVRLRRTSGEELVLQIREVATGGPDKDPFVNPGDKLYIAAAPSFYIYGQVTAPGSYKIDRDMTLRKALARGGGLTDRGSERKIKVFRDGRELSRVDLAEGVKGGDTIVVGERFF